MDYWEECIRIAFEEAGIKATEDQIQAVVSAVEGGHENYSMAFGYDNIPNPISLENEKLKKELQKELDKVVCPECRGTGRIIDNSSVRSSNSGCIKCRGEGYI